jgi:hypothetical protein
MSKLSGFVGRRSVAVPFFFGFFLLIGLLIYQDYGVSFDEGTSRDNGMVSLKHVANRFAPIFVAQDRTFDKVVDLATYVDRDYGVAFEMPAQLIERLLHLYDPSAYFKLRHLLTFLACFGGVIAIYQLGTRRFSDWRLGLLGACWLVLSPRLFAESFYNDKDAVFMASFAIATNTGVRFLLRPTFGRALWHSLACAVAIDVRIMGIVLPIITIGFLGVRALQGDLRLRTTVPVLGVYLLVTAGLVVALWPYLWPAPWANFVQAFNNMKSFRWGGEVLYQGQLIVASLLPWHYVPVWITITTPLLYLGCFVLGTLKILRQLLRRHWRLWQGEQEMQDVLFLTLAVAPVLAVIVLRSVIYDGWRQLYFIYPSLLLVALSGWQLAWQWRPTFLPAKRWSNLVLLLTGLSMAYIGFRMVRAHPYQNVYFNALAGKDIEHRFEVDYWGLSYRQGLEYILATDKRPRIKVIEPTWQGLELSVLMLPPAERARISIAPTEAEAEYFITNYRWHPQPYSEGFEIKKLEADGLRLCSIFWVAKGWQPTK